VFDNIDKQAQVIAYAKEKGVPLVAAGSADRTVSEVDNSENPDDQPAKGQENE
jgi:hypothetical protein